MRIAVPAPWMRYVFAKGYIAINGASLTVSDANKAEGWFEVWLIPETLRMTTFADKAAGAALNIEIERSTQVMVDTVRDAVDERLGALLPALTDLLRERGVDVDALLTRADDRPHRPRRRRLPPAARHRPGGAARRAGLRGAREAAGAAVRAGPRRPTSATACWCARRPCTPTRASCTGST